MALELLESYVINHTIDDRMVEETLWLVPMDERQDGQEVFVVTQRWAGEPGAEQRQRLFVIAREDLQPGAEFAEIGQHLLGDEESHSSDLCRLGRYIRDNRQARLRPLQKGQRARFEIALPEGERAYGAAVRLAERLREDGWACSHLSTDHGQFIFVR